MSVLSVILIIVVAVVLILILAFLKSYTYLVNREFEPDEEIIGESNNEKKALVLYVQWNLLMIILILILFVILHQYI